MEKKKAHRCFYLTVNGRWWVGDCGFAVPYLPKPGDKCLKCGTIVGSGITINSK